MPNIRPTPLWRRCNVRPICLLVSHYCFHKQKRNVSSICCDISIRLSFVCFDKEPLCLKV